MVKRNHHDTHMKQKGVQILRRGLTFALAVSMVLTLPTSSPVLFDLGSKAGTVKAASAAEEDPLVDRSFIKNENLYNAIYKLAYPNESNKEPVNLNDLIDALKKQANENIANMELNIPADCITADIEVLKYFKDFLYEIDFSNSKVDKIPEKVFGGSKLLKKVTLGNSQTSIGVSAFENCSALTDINLGNVDMIASGAFQGCSALTNSSELSLKSKMKSMGPGVFKGCTNLSDVKVPRFTDTTYNDPDGYGVSVQLKGTVPQDMFANCSKVSYVWFCYPTEDDNDADSLKIINESAFAGTGSIEFIATTSAISFKKDESKYFTDKLPSSVNYIAIGAFQNSKIPSIDLSENKGIDTIYERTFSHAVLSKGVKLPQSSKFTTIKDSAFAFSNLPEIVIPNTVAVMEKRAFENTFLLQKVTLSNSLEVIPESAFACYLKKENDTSSGEGSFEYDYTKPLGIYDSVWNTFSKKIPMIVTFSGDGSNNVKTIEDNAFFGSGLVSAYEYDQNLKNSQFYDYSNHPEIYFSTKTDKNRFHFNDGETKDLRDELVGLQTNYDDGMAWKMECNFYGNSAVHYEDKDFLSQLTKLENIYSNAFAFCPLRSIVLPASVKNLGFGRTTGKIDENGNPVKVEPAGIFKGDFLLRSVDFSKSKVDRIPEQCFGSDKAPEIDKDEKDNKTYYKLKSFSSCLLLENVNISEKELTEIGKYAFGFCGTYKVTLPANGTSKLETIKESAFTDNYYLNQFGYNFTEIEGFLPTSLRKLGDNAFSNCKSLRKAYLPGSLNKASDPYNNVEGSIGKGVFSGCINLNHIKVADGVVEIPKEFAKDSYQMPTYVDYKKEQESNGDEKKVPFPSVYKDLNDYFTKKYCTVTDEDKCVPRVKSDSMNSKKSVLYIRKGKQDSKVEPLNNFSDEPENNFSGYKWDPSVNTYTSDNDALSGLSKVELPASIKKIGKSAFQGCMNLTDINGISGRLPAELTEIDESAFEECGSLKEITLNSKLSKIGDSAFKKAAQTMTVSLKDKDGNEEKIEFPVTGLETINDTNALNLSSVGSSAFENTAILSVFDHYKDITTLEYIGTGAFKNCYNLNLVSIPSFKRTGNNSPVIPEDMLTDDINLRTIMLPVNAAWSKNLAGGNAGKLFKNSDDDLLVDNYKPEVSTSYTKVMYETKDVLYSRVVPFGLDFYAPEIRKNISVFKKVQSGEGSGQSTINRYLYNNEKPENNDDYISVGTSKDFLQDEGNDSGDLLVKGKKKTVSPVAVTVSAQVKLDNIGTVTVNHDYHINVYEEGINAIVFDDITQSYDNSYATAFMVPATADTPTRCSIYLNLSSEDRGGQDLRIYLKPVNATNCDKIRLSLSGSSAKFGDHLRNDSTKEMNGLSGNYYVNTDDEEKPYIIFNLIPKMTGTAALKLSTSEGGTFEQDITVHVVNSEKQTITTNFSNMENSNRDSGDNSLKVTTGSSVSLSLHVDYEDDAAAEDAALHPENYYVFKAVSSDPDVVSVPEGTFTADKYGNVVIKVTPNENAGSGATATVTLVNLATGDTYAQQIKVVDENSVDLEKDTFIIMNKTKVSLTNGDTYQLSCETYPDESTAIIWESSDEHVATVDENGLVRTTALGGDCTITAYAQVRLQTANDPDRATYLKSLPKATCDLTIRKFAKSLDFIGNDGKPVDSIKIYMGETGKVTTEVTPADAIDSEVKWSSADPSVASVDENTGDITPVKPGNVIITAATGRGKITKTLKVTIVAKVEKVEISYPTAASPSSVTAKGYINVGESAQLSAKVLPAEAVQDVTWTLTSQEADAATIDALGKVTAFKPGKFTVTASSKDNPNITSEAYEFTVFSPAQGLKIKAPNGNSKVIYVKRKGSVQLGRFISNLDCTDTFKFAASKKKRKIGTVTQDGLFRAKKKTGAVKVYLRSYSVDEEGKVLKQNAQTTITIKVVKKIKKVKRIRLTGSRTVNVNGTAELLAKPSPARNVSCGARWTSSDESIATVDAYGVIRGIKAGTVKINLTGPNKNKVVIKVTVKGEP